MLLSLYKISLLLQNVLLNDPGVLQKLKAAGPNAVVPGEALV